MCDTLCVIGDSGTLFAKSSDRPSGEVQWARTFPRRAAGGTLRTQYLDLGADPGASALTFASQPAWLWGLEHGVNEHRVAIGNEAVYTVDDRRAAPEALLGMDLVRLALERGDSADAAFAILVELLETHGQGGSGWEHTSEPYYSSFLITDPSRAWIVETSQRSWVAKSVDHGGAAISNRLSIATEHTHRSADVSAGADWQAWRNPKAPTGIADHRLAVTAACAASAPSPADIVRALRDHGSPDGTLPESVGDDWSGVTVCMHIPGYQATTASCVVELPNDPARPVREWIALGSPCVSVYVPAFDDALAPELGTAATWNRFAALRDRVEADPTRHDELTRVRAELDPVETELWEAADDAATDPARRRSFAATAFEPVAAALDRLGV